jgi:hypothetical protein
LTRVTRLRRDVADKPTDTWNLGLKITFGHDLLRTFSLLKFCGGGEILSAPSLRFWFLEVFEKCCNYLNLLIININKKPVNSEK